MTLSRVSNIYRLGIKELWSLVRDPAMLVLIAYTFTVSIYAAAKAMPETLNKASIAIVDEDGSPLSMRLASVFYLPHFKRPTTISLAGMDAGMDAGEYTFAVAERSL
jgi:ABC-2 type transport system permease protein